MLFVCLGYPKKHNRGNIIKVKGDIWMIAGDAMRNRKKKIN